MSKPSNKRRELAADFELLLFPMMDMLCSLIPLLLAIASFFSITLVNTSIVTKHKRATVIKEEKFIPLDMNMEVTPEGIKLTASKPIYESQKYVEILKERKPFTFNNSKELNAYLMLESKNLGEVFPEFKGVDEVGYPVQKELLVYNLDQLQDFLFQIKNKYPGNDTIYLVTKGGVKFNDIIRIIDAARVRIIKTETTAEKIDLFPKIAILRK